MGLTLSEIYLHFYQKIKNVICKSKDFFEIISDSVFQSHSREIMILFLCQVLCQIIYTVTIRFCAENEGSSPFFVCDSHTKNLLF